MLKYIRVMKEGDLPIGKSVVVTAKGQDIALFNYKGRYFAVANKCLHKGSPLAEGRIEEGVIICPNHEWRYDIKTGECSQNPYMKTVVYPVKVHKEGVYIGIEVKDDKKALGTKTSTLPTLNFAIPTIQKPINPDEDL